MCLLGLSLIEAGQKGTHTKARRTTLSGAPQTANFDPHQLAVAAF